MRLTAKPAGFSFLTCSLTIVYIQMERIILSHIRLAIANIFWVMCGTARMGMYKCVCNEVPTMFKLMPRQT